MKNSLFSAKQWLSSAAIKLFSSSNESLVSNEDKDSQNSIVGQAEIKKKRGRPKKDSKDPKDRKISKNLSSKRELGQRRSTTLGSRELGKETGRSDDETRFLLTYKALPRNLQILANSIYPSAQNKYEEHRLVCKIINEDQNSKPIEIFIPTFRKLNGYRSRKDIEKGVIDKEHINDEECLQRHRPLELAEKRERKREEELVRYELYIKKLSKEYPELLNRKYPITSDSSLSSLDY